MSAYQYDTKRFRRVVVVAERSAGNGEVGDMWLETKSFPLDAPLKDVFDWAGSRCDGRIMLTLDQSSDAQEGE